MKLLKTAVRERQTVHTSRIDVSVAGGGDGNGRMVHTAVPILDKNGANVERLFIYSEKPE